MPGMGSSLQTDNATVVAAFKSALLRQSLVVVLLLALLLVAWNLIRAAQLRRIASGARRPLQSPAATASWLGPEAPARRLIRLAFGGLWVFDAILQLQSAMPLGLASGVITPSATSSPEWVRRLVGIGTTIWNNHPVQSAAAVVWIQLGIGFFLLVAPRGRWSRAAGAASVGWSMVVWVFGEAFGGIFGPGLTWLFGAPGGVLLYAVAGLLLALPEHSWANAAAVRVALRVTGAFYLGMAVLQAWPGRGFWQGHGSRGGPAGTLTGMIDEMAKTPQPGFLSSWVSAFGAFDAAHGFAVNLVVVVLLAAIGAAFLSARPRLVSRACVLGVVICLADWVLIEDFGFFGGLGTDPNSMIPLALLLVAGYLALVHPPADAVVAPLPIGGGAAGWREQLLNRPSYFFRSLAAIVAVGITLLGVAPMVLASTNPVADPILNEAVNGPASAGSGAAPAFSLLDQRGRTVTLESLRGKVIALTFLDPVCTTDCPVIAQEFRQADTMLGSSSKGAVFVAIVANPIYRSVAVTQAFDREEDLGGISNWLFLTGSPAALERVWHDYGVQVAVEPGGAMVAHADIAYVIDAKGRERSILNADPGAGTPSSESSFAGTVVSEMRTVLAGS